MFYSIKSLIKGYTKYFRPHHLPDELIYFVTYRCNLRCRSCFYYSEPKDIQPELSLEELARISSSLQRLSRVLLSGGEPFLRDDLHEICGIFYKQNKTSNFFIPTNGMLPEKIYKTCQEMLETYPDTQFSLAVSLDGLKDAHDLIRGVKGSFDKALKTISILSTLKKNHPLLRLSVITVISDKNYSEIEKLTEFVKNELKTALNLVPLRGHPQDPDLKPPSVSEWHKLYKTILESSDFRNSGLMKLLRYKLDLSQKHYLHKLLANSLQGKKWPFPCLAGNMIGVLEPDGGVRLCELTSVIGNLRKVNYDFKKIWYSDYAKDQRRQIMGCTCTHGCFLIPSLNYSWPHLLRSFIKL